MMGWYCAEKTPLEETGLPKREVRVRTGRVLPCDAHKQMAAANKNATAEEIAVVLKKL